MADLPALSRKCEYRRRMPHYQKPGHPIFVTFCKLIRDPFRDAARDLILAHCLHDHGKRIDLHAAVVMPDHVHLLQPRFQTPKAGPTRCRQSSS